MTAPTTVAVTLLDDSNPGMSRWPGAAVQLPDGKIGFAYERFTEAGPAVFVREADSPLGPFGEEVLLNDYTVERDAFDPTWLNLGGEIYVVWFGWRTWTAKRTSPGVYEPQQELLEPPEGTDLIEPTVCRALAKPYLAYVQRSLGSSDPWDVYVGRIEPGLTLGPPVLVAAGAQGPSGRNGAEVRPVVVGSGAKDGLICAWSSLADESGERSIVIATSTDAGATWSRPQTVLDYVGHDLFNPFPLKLSDSDVRLYYAQDKAVARCGYLRSTDHGVTWQRFDLLEQGASASYGHAWAFRAVGKSYLFVGVDRMAKLGVYEVTP